MSVCGSLPACLRGHGHSPWGLYLLLSTLAVFALTRGVSPSHTFFACDGQFCRVNLMSVVGGFSFLISVWHCSEGGAQRCGNEDRSGPIFTFKIAVRGL